MHINSALLFTLFAASARAFVVPEDQEDGIYVATGGSNSARFKRDAPSIIKVGDITRTEPGGDITKAIKRGMPINAVNCDNRNVLNAWDYLDARDNFKATCDAGNSIPAWNKISGILYARVGSAIWYGCSWGGDNPCSGGEIDEAEDEMDHNCNTDEAAWVEMQSWKKGYGRGISGMHICDQNP